MMMVGFTQVEILKRSALQSFAHSGDLGRVDEDGFFYVCGRIKELIVTAGGKTMPKEIKKAILLPTYTIQPLAGENIAPVPIEDAIKEELQVFKENSYI